MRFDSFIARVGELPILDLPLLRRISGEPRGRLQMQLHRWVGSGKLIALRRGMYSLAEPYRRVGISPPALANALYRPSYLTGLWALGACGMIPEAVTLFTSATPRATRSFRNSIGTFAYASLKQSFFWGFRSRAIQGEVVWMAEPEKALLDLWHLDAGEWTPERLEGMRFQNFEAVDLERLGAYAARWGSPRLARASARFRALAEASDEGSPVR